MPKCINCKNRIRYIIKSKGSGKNDNVDFEKIECKLGFDIMMGERPGPQCGGRYFEKM